MKVMLDNKEYQIKDELWNMHVEMHPVRSIEALQSNAGIVFCDEIYDSEDIERMILEEYKIHLELPNIIAKAREKYKKIELS